MRSLWVLEQATTTDRGPGPPALESADAAGMTGSNNEACVPLYETSWFVRCIEAGQRHALVQTRPPKARL